MMSMVIQDARSLLQQNFGHRANLVHEIIYADDTVIFDEDGGMAEHYMKCIEFDGSRYGLSLNYDKIGLMGVRCAPHILKPDGTPIQLKSSIVHLGGLLAQDGQVGSEIGRRIGLAFADFQIL